MPVYIDDKQAKFELCVWEENHIQVHTLKSNLSCFLHKSSRLRCEPNRISLALGICNRSQDVGDEERRQVTGHGIDYLLLLRGLPMRRIYIDIYVYIYICIYARC